MYEPNVPAAHGEHGGGHHAASTSASTVLYAENKEAVKEEVVPAVATDATETPAAESHATESHTSEAKAEGHGQAASAHEGHELHAAHSEEHGHAEEVKSYAGFGLVEILIFIGFAGAFLFMFFFELAKHPLLNEKDPYFQESLKHNI
jgi:F0F1-type ATP synthase membrane subunit c/vacuolar-type H+-ATPase subunit K